MKILLEDNLKELESFLKGERAKEFKQFEENTKRVQKHYERIYERFSGTIPLQELKLLDIQCFQIITILNGAIDHYSATYHYATELNQRAEEIFEKHSQGFSKLRLAIKATIQYKEQHLKGCNSTFEDYLILNDKSKQKLMGFLYNRYTNATPKQIYIMLIALKDLGVIRESIIVKQTHLHKALSNTFGSIGTRQAYTSWFSKASVGTSSEEEEEIKAVKRELEFLLEE
jgi:hypothetical protein